MTNIINGYVLTDGQLAGIESANASRTVTALELCSFTLSLAIGNECGKVRLEPFHVLSSTMMKAVYSYTDSRAFLEYRFTYMSL